MNKQSDFLKQLNQYMSKIVPTDYKITIGPPLATKSVAIIPSLGGSESVYMDGTRDKEYQIQIDIKAPLNEQLKAINIADSLLSLELLDDLPSTNNSYEFYGITVTSLPSLLAADEQYYFYSLSISAKLLIYRGVVG